MHRPFLWAHRGASKNAPENTMAAFAAAVELGVDGLELDIHLSRDGIPVVIHDESLERTTNGRGFVSDASLVQLQQLDAGAWFSPEFTGEPLPTLAEVLSVFSGKLRLNLELKEFSTGVEVLSLLRQHLDAEIIISSFDYDLLKGLRSLDEALPLAVLFDNGSWRQAVRCRKLALPVSVWTVDRTQQARSLLRMGVSGLFTNDPGALRSARPALVSTL
jgi:glycerophosphoryl diester phosphodiesterase